MGLIHHLPRQLSEHIVRMCQQKSFRLYRCSEKTPQSFHDQDRNRVEPFLKKVSYRPESF